MHARRTQGYGIRQEELSGGGAVYVDIVTFNIVGSWAKNLI